MSLLPVLSLLLLVSVIPPISVATTSKTAYEILANYNFPAGLLPRRVTGYELDPTTGKFHAYLNRTCSFSLPDSYQLKYKSTISGYISENKLTHLTGVSVKVLFLWLNIVEVLRKVDGMDFSVGVASASFGIDNFYESPECGCGFACNDSRQVSRLRSGSFVSSI